MDNQNSLIFSYTEGGIIAAKLNHKEGDTNYIRTGITFPVVREKYSSTFKPSEDYLSYRVIEPLLELSDIVDENRKFNVAKTNVCYGNSITMVDKEKSKGIVGMFVMNEPLRNSSLSLRGLYNVCDILKEKHQEVSLFKDSGSYLSSKMGGSALSNRFSSHIDLLDIKIPKETVGCRVEFILPEDSYETEKIERPFNDVAQFVGFGKKLSELEKLHEEFNQLKDSYKDRMNVAMVVEV